MAIIVFPSENDVGVDPGDGRAPTEANLTAWFRSIQGPRSRHKAGDNVDVGGVLEASGGGFGFDFVSGDADEVTLEAGEANIQGHHVESTAQETVTLTAASFNWVFLQLVRTMGKVTDAQLTVTTSTSFVNGPGTPPSDSILLYCFQTGAATIQAQFDFRSGATDHLVGEYVGDGNFSQAINIGLRPKLVYVVRRSAPRMAAWSEPDFPIDDVTPTNYGPVIAELEPGMAVAALVQDDALRPRLLETGFQVNEGPTVLEGVRTIRHTTTWNPGNLDEGDTEINNVTVNGTEAGDMAIASFDGAPDLIINAFTAANNVAVRLSNPYADSINPTEQELRILVFKSASASFSLNELDVIYQFVAWF